jgi:hypothetical protein
MSAKSKVLSLRRKGRGNSSVGSIVIKYGGGYGEEASNEIKLASNRRQI